MFDYKSLIAIRKRLGLSQAKMGALLCVSKAQIARLEAPLMRLIAKPVPPR